MQVNAEVIQHCVNRFKDELGRLRHSVLVDQKGQDVMDVLALMLTSFRQLANLAKRLAVMA